ncbi:MAG: PmoA family protein [Sedimentisphaerales bacterium]|nr:PmoA family protein [Sedimentisphaerales bacterium]
MKKLKEIILFLLFLAVVLMSANAFGADNLMRVLVERETLSIFDRANVVLRYPYRNVPFKPYVQELYTPGGVNILRDAPHDHLHHHALMYAIAVDGVNFWEEQKEPGRQQHRSFDDVKINEPNDLLCGGFTEQLDWINPRSREVMLKEFRTIEVGKLNDINATFLKWQSSFMAPENKDSVTLSGSHYFGLGMRFLVSMDTGGQFRNSAGRDGEVVRGDERITRANWCAYTAQADGKPVTVAMFGHPENLRHPTHWFTMSKPFAYLSATLNVYREPLKITAEQPLVLRYAVVLWDGKVEDDRIEQAYDQWIKSE